MNTIIQFFIKKWVKGFVVGTLSPLLVEHTPILAKAGLKVEIDQAALIGFISGLILAIHNLLKHRKKPQR